MVGKHLVIQNQKAQLRHQFRQNRLGINASVRAAHNLTILEKLQSLPEVRSATTLFSYISYGQEVDTRILLDWLLTRPMQILVPKITGNGQMIAVIFDGWTGIQTGTGGVPEPVSSQAYTGEIDVCITPGLGFSASGARLGQGEGYYDRWFAVNPVRYRIAPAFECQLGTEIPTDNHDTPVDIIVTEQRTIRVS